MQLARLVTMHAYCRPCGGRAEAAFIERWIKPLGAKPDTHGNWHLIIGEAPVLWSCHLDTVHDKSGSQKVHLDSRGILTSKSRCLGADDTAGVFLCHELIRRKVPGHYVFHHGEERGCIGSRGLAYESPEWLTEIQIAIALDRHGYWDVITHQIGQRTASETFASALAKELNGFGMRYAPSDRGLFTDTESYAEIVPECTNLSVGYFGEHSSGEELDTNHVFRLLEALSCIDVAGLPVERKPEPEYADGWEYGWEYGLSGLDELSPRRLIEGYVQDPDEGDVPHHFYLDDAYARVQRELMTQLRLVNGPRRFGGNE